MRVAAAHTTDLEWRNRGKFYRDARPFRLFCNESGSASSTTDCVRSFSFLMRDGFAVQFFYVEHDQKGQWVRSHGLEHWEFGSEGLRQDQRKL